MPEKSMTIEQIIENANKRTLRRGEKQLDLKSELLAVMQDFCSRKRFYWRRKTAVVNVVAGTTAYDLTDFTNGDVSDFERMCEPGPTYQYQGSVVVITPAFKTAEQEFMAQDTQTTPGPPAKYWINGSLATINLWPVPDTAYPMRVPYWSTPTLDDPSQLAGTVPTVPSRLHRVLQKGLEAQIYMYLLGEGTTHYQATAAQYEAMIKRETMNKNFAPGEVVEYVQNDHDAIRSSETTDSWWVRN